MKTVLTFALMFLLLGLGSLQSTAQSPGEAAEAPREKPTLKKFGSSLEKLKWDEKTKKLIEPPKIESGPPVEDVIKIKTDLVSCDVLVLDTQSRVVSGLTKNDFLLFEDEQPQAVAHFSRRFDKEIGRTIILIIDYSISMAPFMRLSVGAAKRMVDYLGPKDRMAIVTDDVALFADFESDKKKLKGELDQFYEMSQLHYGRSQQWSALFATVRELISSEDIRPTIIFQTDGDQVSYLQPSSQQPKKYRVPYSLEDIFSATEKSGATVYSVIPGVRLVGLSKEEQLKRANLHWRLLSQAFPGPSAPSLDNQYRMTYLKDRLAEQQALVDVAKFTGGWTAFLEEPQQAAEIYSSIFDDINNRYVVGYYPSNKLRDGTRRMIKIEIKGHPEYRIVGRNSYRAQLDDSN